MYNYNRDKYISSFNNNHRKEKILLNYYNTIPYERILAIIPDYQDNHLSKIITTDGVIRSKKNTNNIMDDICKSYGASLQGKMNAAKDLLEMRKNPTCRYFFNG